ncbi:MAG: hypothetical protein Q9181_007379 [Wetmoreana brouardii]
MGASASDDWVIIHALAYRFSASSYLTWNISQAVSGWTMEITKFIVIQRDKALLVGDYGSYRKQLSRRLLVVRKKLNYASKGRKYTPKTPVTAEDVAGNHESVPQLRDA